MQRGKKPETATGEKEKLENWSSASLTGKIAN